MDSSIKGHLTVAHTFDDPEPSAISKSAQLSEVFDIDQMVACSFDGGHEFVEFQLDSQRVFVLRALNEEDHQEDRDGGAGVDHELLNTRDGNVRVPRRGTSCPLPR